MDVVYLLRNSQYDAVGNLTAEEDALAQRTTYAYNALNWRTGVTDPNSDTTSFAFDAAGNRTSLTDPAGNTTSWVYDQLNRPIEETNELLDTRYFAFDAAGNLIERTDRNGRTTGYVYDNLYRRTEERWLDSSSSITRTLSYLCSRQVGSTEKGEIFFSRTCRSAKGEDVEHAHRNATRAAASDRSPVPDQASLLELAA